MTADNKPVIEATVDDTGKWKIELRNFPELEKALGRDVVNAFCPCFVHSDHLTSIVSCNYASEQSHGHDSTVYGRDFTSMIWFAIGTLRELARAIRDARAALAKRGWLELESDHWAALRKIEDRWENDEFFRTKRNVAAFHVDKELIDKGLNELVKAAQAESGMAVARGHAYAPWGGLPPPGTTPAATKPSRTPAVPFPTPGSTRKHSPNAPRRSASTPTTPMPGSNAAISSPGRGSTRGRSPTTTRRFA